MAGRREEKTIRTASKGSKVTLRRVDVQDNSRVEFVFRKIRFLISMMKGQLSQVTVSLMEFAMMTVIMG